MRLNEIQLINSVIEKAVKSLNKEGLEVDRVFQYPDGINFRSGTKTKVQFCVEITSEVDSVEPAANICNCSRAMVHTKEGCETSLGERNL